METTIGEFAESLLLQEVKDIKKGKKPLPSLGSTQKPVAGAPDISNVQVPNELVESIIAGKPVKKTQVVQAIAPKPLTKQVKTKPLRIKEESAPKAKSDTELLVEFVIQLNRKVDQLIEMTTTGCIGTNMSEPEPVPQKKKKVKKPKADLLLTLLSKRK